MMEWEEGFPSRLMQEVQFVSQKIKTETYRRVSIGCSEQKCSWTLEDGETIVFPYRIYYIDRLECFEEELTAVQQMIYHCIFSRSCDGMVREKHIRALIEGEMPVWAMPYIIKVCDEYVMEILEVVYDYLKDRDTSGYKQICMVNLPLFLYGHNRMISYWNEFYRDRCAKYSHYVGNKLYKECFGYTRSMEKRQQAVR